MNVVEEIINGMDVRTAITNDLLEMANLVGKRVKVEHIDFSFYFSSKNGISHGIRAKIKWDRDKFIGDADGFMELHGDYNYINSGQRKVDGRLVKQARSFFKKYKVLFAAVWENVLDPDAVQEFLRGNMGFSSLLKEFEISMDFSERVKNLRELEVFVRDNSLFNMND